MIIVHYYLYEVWAGNSLEIKLSNYSVACIKNLYWVKVLLFYEKSIYNWNNILYFWNIHKIIIV